MIGVRVHPDILSPIRAEAERRGLQLSDITRVALAEFAAKLIAESAREVPGLFDPGMAA
jgi:hypothetical protein